MSAEQKSTPEWPDWKRRTAIALRDMVRDEFAGNYGPSIIPRIEAILDAHCSAHPDTGKEDGERLDWMEANLTRLHELGRDEVCYRLEYFTDKQEHLATTAKTIRHCIDAARAAQAAPNEGRTEQ